ncbi:MAG: hypothetical protein JWQ83_1345 [Lacunisphaera sp.]|nr:hypothetical protein [Lacunisphaera sp.]
MKSVPSYLVALSGAVIFATAGFLAAGRADLVPARLADDFLETIGVNIKCPSWQNHGSVYTDTALVKRRLIELGVRYYRVNAKDVDTDWDFFRELYSAHGLRADLLHIEKPFPRFAARLEADATLAASVEGPNETDPPKLPGWSYQGREFPAGTIALQRDLYAAVKASPRTRDIPVIVPSVCRENHVGQLAGCPGDLENIHSYPAGNVPTHGLEHFAALADLVLTPPRPIVATETGYSTTLDDPKGGGMSERAQAIYLPRLLAEYWNHPRIVRTYLYELLDERAGPHSLESGFGLLHQDGRPKPAFVAVKALIDLLQDGRGSFQPGKLDFQLARAPNALSHAVLQKRNGDFYLLLWRDVSVFDRVSRSDVKVPDIVITVRFEASVRRCVVYRYQEDGALIASGMAVSNGEIELPVSDSLLLIRISASTASSENGRRGLK